MSFSQGCCRGETCALRLRRPQLVVAVVGEATDDCNELCCPCSTCILPVGISRLKRAYHGGPLNSDKVQTIETSVDRDGSTSLGSSRRGPCMLLKSCKICRTQKNSWYYRFSNIIPTCSEWPAQMFVSVARIQIVSRLQWTNAYDDITHRES
jgi:hypothetical protein